MVLSTAFLNFDNRNLQGQFAVFVLAWAARRSGIIWIRQLQVCELLHFASVKLLSSQV